MQRILDFFLSILGLIFISPILVPIIIILRFSGEGEIFYLQPRIGLNGNVFNIIKLATMLKNSENMGAGTLTLKNDPRVLPIGKFLRKSKINELPQLFNILKGDMNFIGPRPALFNQNDLISLRENHKINHFSPGLTGLAQVNGRDNLSDYEKVNFEKYYKDNKSFLLDLKIIYFSIFKVLKSENVHK